MVAQDIVDYQSAGHEGTITVYDPSIPISRANEKTFFLVPSTRISNRMPLDDQTLTFISQLIQT